MPARTYGEFKDTHPCYKPKFIERLRALCVGGPSLFQNKDVLEELLPKKHQEEKKEYEDRKDAASYTPYAGEIIGSLVSELGTRPPKIEISDDPFWVDFATDTSAPGGDECEVNDLALDAVRTALIDGVAWFLVELPGVELPEGSTLAEQDAEGARDPFVAPLAYASVANWDEDDSGELERVLIRQSVNKWGGLGTRRGDMTYVYTFYDRSTWERWSIVWKDGKEPADKDPMTFVGEGPHSFGRVPVARLLLDEDMWAMGKLESMAKAWFRKRSGSDWSQLRNLFPLLVGKVASSDMDTDGSEAAGHLLNQRGGPGRLLTIGDKDDLVYVSPPADIYTVCAAELKDLRDEMHRVTWTMAQSVDNSGAALQRAASSKQLDRIATSIVLSELGSYARKFLRTVYLLAAAARGEEVNPKITGYDGYDDATTDDLVQQAVVLETVTIPSQTFHVLSKTRLARNLLGKDASDEDIEKIRNELETNITPESLMPPPPPTELPTDEPGAE